MSEAKLKVSLGLLEALVLKGVNAFVREWEVVNRPDGSKYLVLTIDGPDVPDSAEVRIVTEYSAKIVPA